MEDLRFFRIDDETILNKAAKWFSEKWSVPYEAYLESIGQSLDTNAVVPSWYLCMKDEEIAGGLGVIENDFHERFDLRPNVCAVYTEEKYRCQGIAGNLLNMACQDMRKKGIDTLYLVTDHTSFYERYGWEFLCMVNCDGGEISRMYVKTTK